jgi:uncharacterized OB-fold protein
MSSGPSSIEGDFPVQFRYTVGLAGERFFREIKDNGKLIGSHCPKCNLTYLPPRIYCERCMSQLKDYVHVEDSGTVETFTLCRLDPEGKPLPEPVGVAFVRFPSAHGGLVHKLKGKASIGDKVRVVFKEKSKRVGSIMDIECFEKVS